MIYQKKGIPRDAPSCQGFGWVWSELRQMGAIISPGDKANYEKAFADTQRRIDEYLEKKHLLKRSK